MSHENKLKNNKRKSFLSDVDDEEEEEDPSSINMMMEEMKESFITTNNTTSDSNRSSNHVQKECNKNYYKQQVDQHIFKSLEQVSDDDDDDGEDEARQPRLNPTVGKLNAGAIMRIYVENFMCHRRFELTLGPGLHFITGRNGSGKSAIAAALQVCLGATTRVTGRGNNLQGLIREGSQGPAIVQVTLYNEGPDAYCPDKYGPRIMVERRIPRSGGASYHIKGNRNNTFEEISKEKSELQMILRCFDIHVDNPCCILTQEESKKFIQGGEADKYEFFLKATGLQTLKDDLVEITATLDETTIRRSQNDKAIKDKDKSVQRLKEQYESIKNFENIEREVEECWVKLLWHDHLIAEATFEQMKQEVAEKEKASSEVNANFQKTLRMRDGVEDEIDRHNAEISRIQTLQAELESEYKQKQVDVTTTSRALTAKREAVKQLTKVQNEYRERLTDVSRQREELRQKALQKAEVAERAVLERLTVIDGQLKNLHAQEEQVARAKQEMQDKRQRLLMESNRVNSMIENINNNVAHCRERLQSLQRSGNQNKIAYIHPRFPGLLESMKQIKFTDTVIGPIAMHVKIAEGYDCWSAAVERVIGPQLSSFIVTNGADRDILDDIMQRQGIRNVPIIMQTKADRYKVQNVSIQARSPSVLDAVTIANDLVFNCLIDQFEIERILLVNDDEDALKQFVERDHTGQDRLKYGALAIVTAQTLSMIKYAFGNQSSELGGRKVQSLLAKDMTTILTTCQQELQEQERELKIYHDKKIECVNELRQCDSHGQTLHDELHKLSETIRHLNCEKMDRQFELAEFQEGTELDTNVIEQEEMELQQAIELMQTQHQQLQEEEISLQQELKRKQSVKTAAYQHLLELDQQLKEQESSIDHIMINRDQSKKLLNKFRVDAEEAEASHKVALEKQETLQKQVQQTLQLAYEAAKRLNPDWNESNKWNLQTSETRKALIDKKKELESQWKAHQQHYGNNDLSPRIAHERYQKAQRELKELEEQHNGLSSLLESLYHDRDDRKRRIAQVLHKSAKRVKSLFATYVSEKGACGAVIFDHNNKKLHLEYQVDDTDEHTAVNNVRNLAGGERSYVTFSLHLSLGHVIESPFRLMDEYDVFLDNMARQLTLEQLLQYARKPDQAFRQFIIITPHSLNHIKSKIGPLVHIHQLQDPGRNSASGLQQQTL